MKPVNDILEEKFPFGNLILQGYAHGAFGCLSVLQCQGHPEQSVPLKWPTH